MLSLNFVKASRTVSAAKLQLTGLIIKASVPGVRVGEGAVTSPKDEGAPLKSEVVGFKDGNVFLMPLGEARGIGPDSEVIPTGKPFSIKCGYSLLGRTLDGIGDPIDGGTLLMNLADLEEWAVERDCPDPYTRQPVDRPIAMGVRAVDVSLTVGRGQRVGLFAGSGVGKSTLMGQLREIPRQKSSWSVWSVNVVARFWSLSMNLSVKKASRKVWSCATSIHRRWSVSNPAVATAVAEWFRDQGKDVLFMMDSSTRFARAQREWFGPWGAPSTTRLSAQRLCTNLARWNERGTTISVHYRALHHIGSRWRYGRANYR